MLPNYIAISVMVHNQRSNKQIAKYRLFLILLNQFAIIKNILHWGKGTVYAKVLPNIKEKKCRILNLIFGRDLIKVRMSSRFCFFYLKNCRIKGGCLKYFFFKPTWFQEFWQEKNFLDMNRYLVNHTTNVHFQTDKILFNKWFSWS